MKNLTKEKAISLFNIMIDEAIECIYLENKISEFGDKWVLYSFVDPSIKLHIQEIIELLNTAKDWNKEGSEYLKNLAIAEEGTTLEELANNLDNFVSFTHLAKDWIKNEINSILTKYLEE